MGVDGKRLAAWACGPGVFEKYLRETGVGLPARGFDPGTATVSEAKRPAAPPGRYVVTIPHYWPPTLNSLIGRDWTTVHWIKKRDKERVAGEMLAAGVPVAAGKRRVSLRIVLGPKQKAPDPDAFWKCLLDSLVSCGRLTTDSRFGVELGPVEFERGKDRATILTLEDLPCR